jgi:hypothetical protein
MSLDDLFPVWVGNVDPSFIPTNIDTFDLEPAPLSIPNPMDNPDFDSPFQAPAFSNNALPQPLVPPYWLSAPIITKLRRLTKADEASFQAVLRDTSICINPVKLGFIPRGLWSDEQLHFGCLIETFFQKRSNVNGRFHHKLFNALRIVEQFPNLTSHIGVRWITDTILRVDKFVFARILAINTIDGGLFHQQGNFPSNGFVELSQNEARELCPIGSLMDVDFDRVRLLTRPDGVFVRGCSPEEIEDLKRVGPR